MSRRRSLSSANENTEINMSPLIDMVFILLIFFIVTTVFVEEIGIGVEKPTPQPDAIQDEDNAPVVFRLNRNREVFFEGQNVGLSGVRAIVSNARSRKPDIGIMVEAAADAPGGIIVNVMDEAYAAGAPAVSLTQSN